MGLQLGTRRRVSVEIKTHGTLEAIREEQSRGAAQFHSASAFFAAGDSASGP